MADTQSKTLNGKSIVPSLTVDDLNTSTSFFTGLGFEVEDRWEHDGQLLGVMLKAGNTSLGLSQDDGKKGVDRVKGVGVRLYVETTDDINEIAKRAEAAGVTLSKAPHDTEWGARAFEVVEPSGFLLTIASQPST